MTVDLNDLDSAYNHVDAEVHKVLYNNELYEIVNKNIQDQYINLNNLGQNYLNMFDKELYNENKIKILTEMIDYVHKNLITIAEYDNFEEDSSRVMISGSYIYEFICIDFYSSLLPALLELLNITSIEEFDQIVNVRYLESPDKLKNDLLKTIQMMIEQLMKLQNISPNVKTDKNYQKILAKYFYYQEIIDYGDCEMFLHNYIRPIISKYSTDLIWKLL